MSSEDLSPDTQASVSRDDAAMASVIESILLVAAEPVPVRTLARLMGTDSKAVDAGVDFLISELAARGVRLQTHNGRLQP